MACSMSARRDGLLPVGPGCYVRGHDRVTARRAWARGGRWCPDSRGQAAPRGPVNFQCPRGPESPAWRHLPVLRRWHCPHGPKSLRLVPRLLDVQGDRLPRRVESRWQRENPRQELRPCWLEALWGTGDGYARPG